MTDSPLTDSPDAVRAYLHLTTGGDRTAAIVSFADDAHVTDDGRDYRGATEIRTWLDRAASEFTYTTTPLAAHHDGRRTTVTCRVAGTFPGSPVDLDFRFRLDGTRRITRLEIVAAG